MRFLCSAICISLCLTSNVAAEEMYDILDFQEPKIAMEFEEGKVYLAQIHTNKGVILCELYPEHAPLSVTNFIFLAQRSFYTGLKFHRVVPDFVIQGGDPQNEMGGPGYTLPAEIGLKHEKGSLAWARLPDQLNPSKRSSGSQFYITHNSVPYLDGEYTVFGKAIDGMDVVNNIVVGDKIEKIEIFIK